MSAVRIWVARLMLGGLLCLGLYGFLTATPATYSALREHKAALIRLYKHAHQLAQNDLVVEYYSSNSPEFALSFGNSFSRNVFAPTLDALYPAALFLNPYLDRFETFDHVIDSDSVLKEHDQLYFLGTPSNLKSFAGFDPNTLETIDQADGLFLQKWTRK